MPKRIISILLYLSFLFLFLPISSNCCQVFSADTEYDIMIKVQAMYLLCSPRLIIINITCVPMLAARHIDCSMNTPSFSDLLMCVNSRAFVSEASATAVGGVDGTHIHIIRGIVWYATSFFSFYIIHVASAPTTSIQHTETPTMYSISIRDNICVSYRVCVLHI